MCSSIQVPYIIGNVAQIDEVLRHNGEQVAGSRRLINMAPPRKGTDAYKSNKEKKYIGVFFGHNHSPSSDKLANILHHKYRELESDPNKQEEFEFVFVYSCPPDKDMGRQVRHNAHKDAAMPIDANRKAFDDMLDTKLSDGLPQINFPVLPYESRVEEERLSKLLQVDRIPAFRIFEYQEPGMDLETGKFVPGKYVNFNQFGSEITHTDGYPWGARKPRPIDELLQSRLLTADEGGPLNPSGEPSGQSCPLIPPLPDAVLEEGFNTDGFDTPLKDKHLVFIFGDSSPRQDVTWRDVLLGYTLSAEDAGKLGKKHTEGTTESENAGSKFTLFDLYHPDSGVSLMPNRVVHADLGCLPVMVLAHECLLCATRNFWGVGGGLSFTQLLLHWALPLCLLAALPCSQQIKPTANDKKGMPGCPTNGFTTSDICTIFVWTATNESAEDLAEFKLVAEFVKQLGWHAIDVSQVRA